MNPLFKVPQIPVLQPPFRSHTTTKAACFRKLPLFTHMGILAEKIFFVQKKISQIFSLIAGDKCLDKHTNGMIT